MDRTTDHLVGLRLPANHRPMTISGPVQTPLGANSPQGMSAGLIPPQDNSNVVPSGHPFPFPYLIPLYLYRFPRTTLKGVLQYR
jgi:hypothetical protein